MDMLITRREGIAYRKGAYSYKMRSGEEYKLVTCPVCKGRKDNRDCCCNGKRKLWEGPDGKYMALFDRSYFLIGRV